MMSKVANSTRLPYFVKLSIFKVKICKTNLNKHSTGIVPQTCQKSPMTARIYQAKLLLQLYPLLVPKFPALLKGNSIFSGALATNSNGSSLCS